MDAQNTGVRFNSRKDLQDFLNNRISKLNTDQEYNLMTHEIQYRRMVKDKSIKENLKNVMSNIFKYGFDVNGYPTVFGTMTLLGSSIQQNLGDDILNYNYYVNQKYKTICILAIPKHVTIDEKAIEFSSFNGTSAQNPDKDLESTYKKYGFAPDIHDYKCCVLDLVKGLLNLPKCYTLGAIEIDDETGQYIYYDNDNHLSYQDNDFKTRLKKEIETKVLSLFKKHQTTDLKEIMVNEYKQELQWINEKLDFDI